eukprot:CAMPEP_0196718106 /NCGR_PEP_ID=MMETSP1091-20130531/1389_1 /TAXON_ID=302021 /ORGANISM="Rhodomonas sp., Strain CCMP768" /LENGTH=272 /DNA_ID=CAMNT_0042058685 /DNA_START=117 /DNA_END=932 /DNA_ORIENTATION=-
MVRPHASEGSKHLAVLFAKTVTTEVLHVAPASASVGRSGQYSVFDALSICFPQAARGPSRNGVSLVELNKSLEKEGFVRVRFRNPRKARRKKDDAERASRKWRDPENQSFYRYGNRRWRDPECAEDLAYLQEAWPLVNRQASSPCPLSEVLGVLRRAIAADLASEAVQRKLVGLEFGPRPCPGSEAATVLSVAANLTASRATTPARDTPVSAATEEAAEGSTDDELSDSDDDWVQTVVFPDLLRGGTASAAAGKGAALVPPPWREQGGAKDG